MKRMLFIFLLFFISSSLSISPSPSGLYISFSDVAMSSVASIMTSDVVNEANAYTGWQSISGSSSSASYTISGWQVSIVLEDPQWKEVNENEIMIGWREFNFTIQVNYHICANSWPNPCENGYIQIFTTDSRTRLFLDTILDLTGTTPFVNVSAADLSFSNTGIDVYVHCTNTFCLIPVSDVSQAVAQNFQTLFQDAVAKSATSSMTNILSKFKTEFEFSDGLGIDVAGAWDLLPGNTGGENGVLFTPTTGGFFIDVNGANANPPFPPSFVPPLNVLLNPQQELNIAITEYFFQSMTWALADLNFFSKVITASDVPVQSPVKLNSNDGFFQQVVPGLKSYPNMDITVTTKIVDVSIPSIDTSGLHVYNTNITFDFSLSNSSFSTHGWTLSNLFDLDFSVTPSISGNVVTFTSAISNFNSTVIVAESDLGTVMGAGFTSLYKLLESQIKVPLFTFNLPEAFSASNPSIQYYNQFIQFGADFSISEMREDLSFSSLSSISIA